MKIPKKYHINFLRASFWPCTFALDFIYHGGVKNWGHYDLVYSLYIADTRSNRCESRKASYMNESDQVKGRVSTAKIASYVVALFFAASDCFSTTPMYNVIAVVNNAV